ncbi:MAG: hypothetical protein D6701_14985, partial [Gemmatimonadetes bacterium]
MRSRPAPLLLATLVCGALTALAAPAASGQSVRGAVVDEITQVGVRGVTVVLLDAKASEVDRRTTDDRGRFSFEGIAPGTYSLLAQAQGYPSVLSPELNVTPGATVEQTVQIAALSAAPAEAERPETPEERATSLARMLAAMCEGQYDPAREGILVGVVYDRETSVPLPDVLTRLEWVEDGRIHSVQTRSSGDGSFVFCAAPAGEARVLTAELGDVRDTGASFPIRAGTIKRRDVALALSSSDRPGDVLGRVTDFDTGEPIASAEVRLKDTGFTAVTDASGQFAFHNVPWGVYFLEVEHLGYAPQVQPVRIMGDRAHDLRIRLATEAIEIAPVRVEVHARDWFGGMRGFRERKSRGFGYFIDRKDIEKRGALRVLDILREIPGVQVDRAQPEQGELNPERTTTEAIYFRGCWRYQPDGSRVATSPVLYVNGVKSATVS